MKNLSTTLPDTEAIINNIPTSGVDPHAIEVTLGLKRAFQYVKNIQELTFKNLLEINKAIKDGEPGSGEICSESVVVPLTSESWTLPIPEINREKTN